jgi:hypothetical protein
MTAKLKAGQTVRIFKVRENAKVDDALAEQKLPRRLIGTYVRISTVGDYGVSFYPLASDGIGNPREYHLFYTRIPNVFNPLTIVQPTTPVVSL